MHKLNTHTFHRQRQRVPRRKGASEHLESNFKWGPLSVRPSLFPTPSTGISHIGCGGWFEIAYTAPTTDDMNMTEP